MYDAVNNELSFYLPSIQANAILSPRRYRISRRVHWLADEFISIAEKFRRGRRETTVVEENRHFVATGEIVAEDTRSRAKRHLLWPREQRAHELNAHVRIKRATLLFTKRRVCRCH